MAVFLGAVTPHFLLHFFSISFFSVRAHLAYRDDPRKARERATSYSALFAEQPRAILQSLLNSRS